MTTRLQVGQTLTIFKQADRMAAKHKLNAHSGYDGLDSTYGFWI
jgi:hypothetical protein